MNLQLDKVCSTSHRVSCGVRIANLCQTLSTCQQFNAEVCYGSGINSSMPSIEELMSKGERVTSNDYRCICREIEEFTLDNALPSYFLGVCQDFKQLNNLLTLGIAQARLHNKGGASTLL